MTKTSTKNKKPKCGAGQSCGFACIEASDTCTEKLDGAISKAAVEALRSHATAALATVATESTDFRGKSFAEVQSKFSANDAKHTIASTVVDHGGGITTQKVTLVASDGSGDTLTHTLLRMAADGDQPERIFTLADGAAKEYTDAAKHNYWNESRDAAIRAAISQPADSIPEPEPAAKTGDEPPSEPYKLTGGLAGDSQPAISVAIVDMRSSDPRNVSSDPAMALDLGLDNAVIQARGSGKQATTVVATGGLVYYAANNYAVAKKNGNELIFQGIESNETILPARLAEYDKLRKGLGDEIVSARGKGKKTVPIIVSANSSTGEVKVLAAEETDKLIQSAVAQQARVQHWNAALGSIQDQASLARSLSKGNNGDGWRTVVTLSAKDEDSKASSVEAIENKLYGRSPSSKTAADYEPVLQQEAVAWAQSRGFTPGGVNGFTADATSAHDVGHPAAHRLARMSSVEMHRSFGSLMAPDGKPSLLAEEAIVNIVEHLSRGDTVQASIVNGARLARVLSRTGTDEERAYVRDPKFANALYDLTMSRIMPSDDHAAIMGTVRKYNRLSGTVTSSGVDFNATASGG